MIGQLSMIVLNIIFRLNIFLLYELLNMIHVHLHKFVVSRFRRNITYMSVHNCKCVITLQHWRKNKSIYMYFKGINCVLDILFSMLKESLQEKNTSTFNLVNKLI